MNDVPLEEWCYEEDTIREKISAYLAQPEMGNALHRCIDDIAAIVDDSYEASQTMCSGGTLCRVIIRNKIGTALSYGSDIAPDEKPGCMLRPAKLLLFSPLHCGCNNYNLPQTFNARSTMIQASERELRATTSMRQNLR